MSGAFTSDTAAFFSAAEFADSAVLGAAPVEVIFDRDYIDATGLASGDPVVRIRTASVPTSVYGMPLTISTGVGAGAYKVDKHVLDGTGLSILSLLKA